MLLPQLDQGNIYNSVNFNHYWNEASSSCFNNRQFTNTIIPSIQCPSDPITGSKPTGNSSPFTYCFSAGPVSHWSQARGPGPFAFRSSTQVSDVTDGTSNTIAMSEYKMGDNRGFRQDDNKLRNSSAGNLTSPIGPSRQFSTNSQDIQAINSYYQSCVGSFSSLNNGQDDFSNRFWASGRVFWGPWFNTLIPPNPDGPSCDADGSVTTMDVKSATSYHTGGVNTLMLDGSVHFVSENIDQRVWIASGSKDLDETESLTNN